MQWHLLGIDVQQVSLVINYDLPANRENYIHRFIFFIKAFVCLFGGGRGALHDGAILNFFFH